MVKLAIFGSGSGSNFEALATACASGEIGASIALMVCDVPSAQIVERAQRLGIPHFVAAPSSFGSKREYEEAVVEQLRLAGVDLICLAGYMRIVGDTLLNAFEGRIVNVHPSLLPAFKGARAIEQALEYGVKIFGVSIHYVSKELDSGRIIDQESFRYEGSDIEELREVVHQVEHPLYIRTVRGLVNDFTKK